MTGLYNGLDNTNVNVFDIGGETVALSDFWEVYGFDRNTLSNATMFKAKLPDGIPEIYNNFHISSVAHPLHEYCTNAVITLAIIDSPVPFYSSLINVIRVHSLENQELIASIEMDRAPYMHSFALTENYAIIFADPMFVNVFGIFRDGYVVDSIYWEPERDSTVYIVSLKDGTVKNLKTPAMFHAHSVNAFEQNDEITIQYITHASTEIYHQLSIRVYTNETLRKQELTMSPSLTTYVIDSKHETITRQIFLPTNKLSIRMDLPVINENYRFKRNCYVYGVDTHEEDCAIMSIVKRDVCRGQDLTWHKSSHYPSEAIFVAAPNAVSEDDGVLLSVVLDGKRKESYLLVLDAKTMTTRAVSPLPHLVPFSIHGQFF